MTSHPRPRRVFAVLALFSLLSAGCSTLPPVVPAPEATHPAAAVAPVAEPSPAVVIQAPIISMAPVAAMTETAQIQATAVVTESAKVEVTAPVTGTTGMQASETVTGTSPSASPIATTANGALTGQVTYRQRIALQPDAVVEVELQDVSRARVVAKQRIETQGAQVPIQFKVEYDPLLIDSNSLYTVRARIIEGGQVTWITAEPPRVISGGAPTDGVEVTVQQAKSARPAPPAVARLNGVVSCLQRIALSPNAVIEVKLQDVSREDAPAIEVASQTIKAQGKQVPIPYSLEYDPASIDPKMTYAVSARITEDGALTWISTKMYPVLTRGAPTNNVEIVVEPVR